MRFAGDQNSIKVLYCCSCHLDKLRLAFLSSSIAFWNSKQQCLSRRTFPWTNWASCCYVFCTNTTRGSSPKGFDGNTSKVVRVVPETEGCDQPKNTLQTIRKALVRPPFQCHLKTCRNCCLYWCSYVESMDLKRQQNRDSRVAGTNLTTGKMMERISPVQPVWVESQPSLLSQQEDGEEQMNMYVLSNLQRNRWQFN